MDTSSKKTKTILFLHGHMQSGHILELKLKALTKKLTKKYRNTNFNFLFPDAPIILKNPKDDGEIYRCWIDMQKPPAEFVQMETADYIGLTNAIKFIYELGEKNPNIDCIFTFSQGSGLIINILILWLYKTEKYNFEKYFPNLKCLVICSGFCKPIPSNEEFKDIYDIVLNKKDDKFVEIPSLHVYGIDDVLLPSAKSKEVLKFFKNYEEFPHKGKHFVPTDKAAVERFENFLEKYLELE